MDATLADLLMQSSALIAETNSIDVHIPVISHLAASLPADWKDIG